jgi:hypothetical protein
MHPEIEKFWSGDGVYFSTMENSVDPYKGGSDMNILYCRNIRQSEYVSIYTVVAKSAPYPRGSKPIDTPAKIYYLNSGKGKECSKTYSEEEMLRIIRLKVFI